MGCVFRNKEYSTLLANNMESYFKKKPPDCSLFSQENNEFSIHKELLYQTKFLREMVQSLDMDLCCCKIEIFCPDLSKVELDIIVQFLYKGKIFYSDQTIVSQVTKYLTQLLDFHQ